MFGLLLIMYIIKRRPNTTYSYAYSMGYTLCCDWPLPSTLIPKPLVLPWVAFYPAPTTNPLHLHPVCVANGDGPHGNWQHGPFICYSYECIYRMIVNPFIGMRYDTKIKFPILLTNIALTCISFMFWISQNNEYHGISFINVQVLI